MERFKTGATTTLAGNIDASQTSISVAAASALISSGTYRILIDSEILTVTGVSSNTLTVIRGTGATSHSSGAAVIHILTAEGLQAHNTEMSQSGLLADVPVLPAGALYLPTDSLYSPTDGPNLQLLKSSVGAFTTWYNQDSSTLDESTGIGKYFFLNAVQGCGGHYKATAGTKTYTLGFVGYGRDTQMGIGWYSSAGAKFAIFARGLPSPTNYTSMFDLWVGAATGAAVSQFTFKHISGAINWLRSSYDSSTDVITCYYSIDGFSWLQLYSFTATTLLGGIPTHAGIGVRYRVNLSLTTTVLHWE